MKTLLLLALAAIDITADPGTVVSLNGAKVSATQPMTTAWVRVALENEPFSVAGSTQVRFGDGINWAVKTTSVPSVCSVAVFGDPKPGQVKFCEAQVTVPAVTQTGGMPVINPGLIPKSALSYPGPRVRALTPAELANPTFQPTPTTVGAVRFPCSFSHFSQDDPIVYPNQPGASHGHTFIGNDGANADSTPASLASMGGSTCAGGTLNRTSYWMPSLIDMNNGQPIVPTSTSFYYKLGYLGVKAGTVKSFPKGLRMVAGDAKNTSPITSGNVGLECVSGGGHQKSMPTCKVGDELNLSIIFPQCWDGKNLDSPDHKSHMAYASNGCPATHPVPLPEIALNVHYKVTEANPNWRLSSDMYTGPAGYSMHADWYGGWDQATNDAWVKNCINGNMDCHAFLLGDGRILY